MSGLHPSTAAILRHFRYEHLPERLQSVSRPFCDLAREMAERLPSDPELTAGLRHLLEAKDCAVRAELARDEEPVRYLHPDAIASYLDGAIHVWRTRRDTAIRDDLRTQATHYVDAFQSVRDSLLGSTLPEPDADEGEGET